MGWVKKCFHKFFIDEKGAVSIYAIIITLLLFIFNGVLIDFVRIMAAERETDNAIKAAIRSTMSAYNQDVKGYGLFGFDGGQGEADEIFKKVFEENLDLEEGDYYRFIDTKPEGEITTTLDEDRMLSNKTTIEYQILEEMKYIAPMEVGKSIIEGFLQVSEAMEQASVYVDIAESIQKDVDKREEKLDKAKEKLDDARGKSSSSSILATALEKSIEAYNDLISNPPDDDASDEDKAAYEQSVKTAEAAVIAAATALLAELNNVLADLQEALKLVEEAEELNKKVEKTIKDKRAEARNNYGSANEAAKLKQKDKGNANGTKDGIAEANAKLDDYVIKQAFFDSLKGKINEAIILVESNIVGVSQFLASFPGGGGLSIDISGQTSAIDGAVTIITKDRPVIKDEEVKEKDKEADKNLEDVNKQLDDALREAAKYTHDNQLLQEIAVLAEKYQGAIESSQNEFNREDPDKAAKDAMDFVDKVFKAIGDTLLDSRDKVYINEYILTKFKSHDFKLTGADSFSLENNEVEYILYGLNTTGANFSAAMTELFAFRFAVNFLEAFTKPHVRAFGPYMWVAALAYALEKTIDDLVEIQKGKSIQFFSNLKFETTYKDYLRIFLLIHPEGNKIARMMALIENNTGADLTMLPTYMSGEASTSVKLWFLPGVTKMLGQTGAITGRVENGRYFIDKKIDYSY
ncbi:DUF5702 domain-containing protein [Cytobacillus massiliigabonensis]|uniref:DUF5702 domain-containing protein n=1 Tax=Cytobacillus massiliigabonensis TaxID=1871011 RepID=UPI000C853D9A|nr:DUF5702 domain-containing protein [Cytobacillus massiliigabonensis]